MPRDIEFNADGYHVNTTQKWLDIFGENARVLCVTRNIGGGQGGPVVIKHVDKHGFSDGKEYWDTVAPIFIDGNNKPIMLIETDTAIKYDVLWESVFIFDNSIKRRKI